jgi:elongator complex protein 3
LSFETGGGRLAGFLRLALPTPEPAGPAREVVEVLPELQGAALIREVHVYGPALGIGTANVGDAQHMGLGRRLIDEARRIAREAGYPRIAVISAIGTRRYYESLGFWRHSLYHIAAL